VLGVFCAPGRYVQGRDATEQLGDEMAKIGLEGPALIVSSPSPRRLLARAWEKSLGAAGFAYRVHAFGGECSKTEIERLVEANTLLSGLGFESGGLAVAHSVHNGLTTAPPTHAYLHGEKVAFGLVVQLVIEGRPTDELDQVLDFANTVGLPSTLAQLGLGDPSQETMAGIAERTLAPGETAHNEPFELSPATVTDAMWAADAIGRTRRPRPGDDRTPG
jgi:glycerol dehydrogenase-like iron-containing ADH family enzyme